VSPLFRPTTKPFSAIADFLGFLEVGAATTEYENGPVKPRLDVGLSIQKSAVWRTFIYSVPHGAGATTASVTNDFFTSTNWDAIEVKNVASVLNVVPPTHEAIVVGVGGRASVDANLTSISITRRRIATIGEAGITLFWGDTGENTNSVSRNSTHDSAILMPLPWYFPPLTLSNEEVIIATAASDTVTLVTVFHVLSAPPGVFTRIP